jgi:signal transduction histidine kinase
MKIFLKKFDPTGGSFAESLGALAPTEGKRYILGRDPSADIVIDARSISRRQAGLKFDDGRWLIEDLKSSFGTLLNGETVTTPRQVQVGDLIRLGRELVIITDSDNTTGSQLMTNADDPAAISTVDPAEIGSPETSDTPETLRYRKLISILESVAGSSSAGEILQVAIREAGEAVAADRGVIILADGDSGRWRPDTVAAWSSEGAVGGNTPLSGQAIGQISQTVLREAIDTRQTVFLKYAGTDPRYEEAASIHLQSVQTLLCCPLTMAGKQLGAFYLDRKHQGSDPFSDQEREFLETLAGLVAQILQRDELLRHKEGTEKLALLGTMVSRITHELKNPLYNIRGTAENILEKLQHDQLVPDDLNRRLDRLLAGVAKAENRLGGLLRFARPATGPRQPVRIARILNAAAVDCATLFADKKIKLVRSYDREPRIQADAEALEQVFSNLLVNAAQALENTPDGVVTISCATSSRLDTEIPDWIEISVADNGPGIPEESRSRIFDDFFTTRSGGGGSGLGLAICHQIVTQHLGSVEVTDAPDGGALFRVGLPLLEPEEMRQ